MDKKILVVAVIAVVIIAAAAAVLLGSGNGDKEDSKTGYTITFDANGGSGTMAPVTGVSGWYTIPTNCDFTAPEGYSFQGWGLSRGMSYAGDIEVTSDTTLYAIWKDDGDMGAFVMGAYGEGVSSSSPILSDVSFIYETGGKTYGYKWTEFKSVSVPFNGSAKITINVNGSSGWSFHIGKLGDDEDTDFSIFEFTYDGEKYMIAFDVENTGAKTSGSTSTAPTFEFSVNEKASLGVIIGKVA